MRPLRSDRDVDLRPGQHQPLLHRRLHLRDAAQDVRPGHVLLQGHMEPLRLLRRHVIHTLTLSQRPHRKVLCLPDHAQSGEFMKLTPLLNFESKGMPGRRLIH